MTNGELSVFLLTCISPNINVTHGTKARLVSFWSFGMYPSFWLRKCSLLSSADSQSRNQSVPELMVNPVNKKNPNFCSKLVEFCKSSESMKLGDFAEPTCILPLVIIRKKTDIEITRLKKNSVLDREWIIFFFQNIVHIIFKLFKSFLLFSCFS